MINEKIESILAEIQDAKAKTEKEIEELRVHLLGKKGEITQLFEEFRTISADKKKEFGQKLNNLKNAAAAKIEELRNSAAESSHFELGTRHPISITREEIISIFRKQGYALAEGPEIEDDHHVFEALNFPPDHPARDMQDTFFISSGVNPVLLRTHTSSVQVRTMENRKPPIRVICPGRVFRNEAISLLLPLHGAQHRGGHQLQHLRRQGLQHLQGHRLARDHGRRHGRPQRPGSLRHRPQGVHRLRVWHGN